MAQSAFAAGGGNAKMAQLKKLQANRNLSPAALRKLVEQIGQRALRKSPGAFSVAAQPRKGKGGPAAKTEAAKPKPKPQPARSSTYSQAAMMKDIRAGEAAAARSKELKKLQELREEAKKKSLAQAKKNRARGNGPRGPRG